MILLPLAAAIALGPIGRQELPVRGCSAFLWSQPANTLIAMVGADPAFLRLQIDGRAVDLPLVAQSGTVTMGLPARADYRAGGVAATLELTVTPRQDLTDGAQVSAATLTVIGAAGEAVIAPAVGLVGCTPAQGT